MSGSGFRNQSADRVGAASTRYGGIVDNSDEFKSRHIQAVSVKSATRLFHDGGHQSAGQPDHADGIIRGGDHPGPGVSSSVTPCGSPGVTNWSGPTVAGGFRAGSFGFGVMSSGGGGRIARVNKPITDTEYTPSV